MRADAQRNRRILLDAAARAFRESGPDAPLEVIARRAKVGIATLYRHFPQRSSLVAAVAVDVMERTLAEATAAAAEEPDGLAALRRFMHRALDVGAPAIMPRLDPDVRAAAAVKALLDATAAAQADLIARAAEEGSLRPGVEFSDVGLGLAGEDRLVADDHAVLVGAHLGAPHPERPAEQDGVGVLDLWDLDPGGRHGRSGGVVGGRVPLEALALVGVAVTVLGEQDALVGDDHHRVAHGRRTVAAG